MKTFLFEVWQMDMLPDEDCGWVENDRLKVGELRIRADSIDCITDKMLLQAMSELHVGRVYGKPVYAISTIDRRRVYAEDYSGDGTWWEVGVRKGHEPVYGLRLVEEAA